MVKIEKPDHRDIHRLAEGIRNDGAFIRRLEESCQSDHGYGQLILRKLG
jgi:hypothetical protein